VENKLFIFRDGKIGWTRRVGPFNPSFLTGWVEVLNPPQVGCPLPKKRGGGGAVGPLG